ncbi:hypothetical protein BCR41DRAFT_385903 [Lobosporangium transversale]|uniref:Tropomyosin n=1 Tax=Lobosporangium transversale TaxID=64571 RepID=A0A1Y2GQU6_9FUNG|nr:hypothetical protein BCR41DRAFT_385903 [Lobosporangium transversale]ORZ18216.1 hypothetical protein BCR41DRAFT_385903 [Lobosporangium transversale]|eukprot:XP_021882011.1 hypothetical protein BCR41DRAFT_385903 [Lobosporangium transversale]
MDKLKEKFATVRAEADAAIVRAEEAERLNTSLKDELAAKDQEAISLNNRIQLLEAQLEKAESGGSDSKTKLRELELKVEDLERKTKTLEKDNENLETKLEEATTKLREAKAELEETLRAMDDM